MALTARFTHFSYWYPDTRQPALNDLEAVLQPGFVLLTGASGSGKSTLLRCLDGLVPHFHGGEVRGEAEVLGLDLRQITPRRMAGRVAVVFQEPEAQMVMPVVEQEIAFGPANLGLEAAVVRRRTEAAMAWLGISHLAQRRLGAISGGERQRVALAGALAMSPDLLVLDEPTSQLDPDGARQLRRCLDSLIAQGVSVVAAEHRPQRLPGAVTQEISLVGGRLGPARFDPSWPARAARPSATGDIAWIAEGMAVGHESPILEDLKLSCRQGEVVAITGPNGAGKTTLLRTLAGLLAPLRGKLERRPGRAAYLPQDPGALLHQATVRREVEQTARWLRLPADAQTVLAQFGIAHLADHDPRDLSTGQRQRVALAAVLIGSPQMVFLDEPTRGADQRAREMLVAAIDRLAESGSAVMVATSDREFAQQVGDSTWVAEAGRVAPIAPVPA